MGRIAIMANDATSSDAYNLLAWRFSPLKRTCLSSSLDISPDHGQSISLHPTLTWSSNVSSVQYLTPMPAHASPSPPLTLASRHSRLGYHPETCTAFRPTGPTLLDPLRHQRQRARVVHGESHIPDAEFISTRLTIEAHIGWLSCKAVCDGFVCGGLFETISCSFVIIEQASTALPFRRVPIHSFGRV
jgi:hypothetical protein